LSTDNNNNNDLQNDTTQLLAGDDTLHDSSSATESSGAANPIKKTDHPTKRTLKNRFILDSVIAKGGMGIVYKARDLRKIEAMDNDPYIAIKLLKPESKTLKKDFINLQRETRKTQMLSHPNIVNVHDFDRDGDIFMMTMEYLQGFPLSDKINSKETQGITNWNEAYNIINGVGKALVYAHSKNIIHCDLKPANIFITHDNSVKVLDFGIARAFQVDGMLEVNESLNKGTLRALTPAYASSEVLKGKIPEPRDDIFAFACIAYELLTGKHPFKRKNCTQAREEGIEPAPINNLSRKQWRTLSSALAENREDRPESVREFMRDFLPATNKGTLRYWTLPAISTIILLILLVSYQFLNRSNPGADAITAIPFETLSQDKQEKIISLLEIADAHMMVQRYTEPSGSNALSAYQQVLDIHPANPQALSGLNKIADIYVRLANTYLENGNNQTAQKLIQEGLLVIPNHEPLLKLLEQLN